MHTHATPVCPYLLWFGLKYRIVLSEYPWALGIHGPKNQGWALTQRSDLYIIAVYTCMPANHKNGWAIIRICAFNRDATVPGWSDCMYGCVSNVTVNGCDFPGSEIDVQLVGLIKTLIDPENIMTETAAAVGHHCYLSCGHVHTPNFLLPALTINLTAILSVSPAH